MFLPNFSCEEVVHKGILGVKVSSVVTKSKLARPGVQFGVASTATPFQLLHTTSKKLQKHTR